MLKSFVTCATQHGVCTSKRSLKGKTRVAFDKSSRYSSTLRLSLSNHKIKKIYVYGIYIALYPDAQSALQHFAGDFARLLI